MSKRSTVWQNLLQNYELSIPKMSHDDPFDDNVDDRPIDPYAMNITIEFIMGFPKGIVIKK